jgi:hypothetical protein
MSPRQYVPVHLATDITNDEIQKLDIVHAWGGVGGGYPGAGYGGRGVYGRGLGFGWSRWAVSFLVIFLLWDLLW